VLRTTVSLRAQPDGPSAGSASRRRVERSVAGVADTGERHLLLAAGAEQAVTRLPGLGGAVLVYEPGQLHEGAVFEVDVGLPDPGDGPATSAERDVGAALNGPDLIELQIGDDVTDDRPGTDWAAVVGHCSLQILVVAPARSHPLSVTVLQILHLIPSPVFSVGARGGQHRKVARSPERSGLAAPDATSNEVR